MIAPPTFTITIHGRTTIRPDQWHGLHYLIERLLSGQEVADTAFESYGLTVHVE